jgi:hypothetical protein
MTMILRTKRPTFAVLAADEWISDPEGQTAPSTSLKVAAHPRLPLALAFSGPASWTNFQPTLSLLNKLIASVDSISQLTLAEIGRLAQKLFFPGLAEIKRPLGISIALVNNGKAEAGLIQICENPWLADDLIGQIAPAGLFHCDELGELHDPRRADPKEVSKFAANLVERGIRRQRKLAVSDRTVGGDWVDVATVCANAVTRSYPILPDSKSPP